MNGLPTWKIPMILSRGEFVAIGLDEANLVDDKMADMRATFDTEIDSATESAASIVADLTGRSRADVLASTRADLDAAHSRGWQYLQNALTGQARELVSSLDEEELAGAEAADAGLADAIEEAGISLPFGIVRTAVALAGGYGTGIGDQGVGEDGRPLDEGYIGGVGNGDIFSEFMGDEGMTVQGYSWTHGFSDTPFEPHLELDGYEFTDFTDDGLSVEGDFPSTSYYIPGDHDGCSCDLTVIWTGGEEAPDVDVEETEAA
jgi:hypothetical protein